MQMKNVADARAWLDTRGNSRKSAAACAEGLSIDLHRMNSNPGHYTKQERADMAAAVDFLVRASQA